MLSEIYVGAQRTEGPMAYADRRFSDNSESGILIKNNSAMVTKLEYTRMLAF